jgi:hypothetical protein
VERSTFVAAKDGYEWKVVKRLPPSRHRLHLVDLPTLSSTAFRVVAVFPSGLRSAVATPWVATRPPPVSRVRALVGADRVVTVTWDDVGSGGFASDYLVEKQTAGGRWVRAWPMGHVHFFYDFQRRFFDYVPAFGGTVRYRVGSASAHLRSTWTYSATIDIAEPDIEVRQEGGIATVDELGATELEVTGTITDGEPDPAPLALEQRDFELVIGGVGQPVRILAPESSGSWTRKGRVLRLEYSPFDDTVDRVVFEYDERTGRFRAHQWISEYSVPPIFTPGRRTQVEVGVASGTRAGGDVRTWQPVGRRGVFVLR